MVAATHSKSHAIFVCVTRVHKNVVELQLPSMSLFVPPHRCPWWIDSCIILYNLYASLLK